MNAILYEAGNYWVGREDFGSGKLRPKTKGFAVYANTGTHSIRVATFGFPGADGLKRAIAECDKRARVNV